MKATQRYISNELTHFIGRQLRDSTIDYEEKQYEILLGILNSGLLTHSTTAPMKIGLLVSENNDISRNEMYNPNMVCFCDIPLADLTIHSNKYSRFGLSFSKDFIIDKGGLPMYYIPEQARIPSAPIEYRHKSIDKYFNKMVKHYRQLFELLICATPNSYYGHKIPPLNPKKAPKKLTDLLLHYPAIIIDLRWFLDFCIFSYLKFFNHNLSDQHKKTTTLKENGVLLVM